MIAVNVLSEIVIARSREEVALFAANPANAPVWYENIKSVKWLTSPSVMVGSRIAFVAHFLGRRMTYTYEIVEFVPNERLTMKTSEGPFPMETIYTWESSADGSTRMTLRNRGNPSGFSRFVAPFMSAAMRSANGKDLRRLKNVLENHTRHDVSPQ